MTYGITIPVPEALITEIGDAAALALARHRADRLARREHGSTNLIEHNLDVQTVPVTDPDTGELLPPMRLYRFRYR